MVTRVARVRLLHIITGLSTGGAERALHNLLSSGLQREFDCHVLSLTPGGRYADWIREQGIPVHSLNLRLDFSLLLAPFRLFRLLRAIRPDLIQGWMYHGNVIASLSRFLLWGRPALVWNIRHSLYDLQAEKFLTRQVIRLGRRLSQGADVVLYNSRVSRDQHERFGFSARASRVIPNGFDTDALCPDPERRRAVRRQLEIGDQERVIGHVARFHPLKDHAGLLRAAVWVLQETPEVRFLLVGRNVSLDNPALSGIVPPHFVDHFLCLGERTDVFVLMQGMDVFCQSSCSEAFPNALGEAMAAGVPCVATDVGDSALIVGDTGVVVPPEDDNALFNGLMTLLDNTPAERRALGREARARVETHFGLAVVVNEYANLYENLAAGRRPGEG